MPPIYYATSASVGTSASAGRLANGKIPLGRVAAHAYKEEAFLQACKAACIERANGACVAFVDTLCPNRDEPNDEERCCTFRIAADAAFFEAEGLTVDGVLYVKHSPSTGLAAAAEAADMLVGIESDDDLGREVEVEDDAPSRWAPGAAAVPSTSEKKGLFDNHDRAIQIGILGGIGLSALCIGLIAGAVATYALMRGGRDANGGKRYDDVVAIEISTTKPATSERSAAASASPI